MANVQGGGGPREWDRMNDINIDKVRAWLCSDEMQVNTKDAIGVRMCEFE